MEQLIMVAWSEVVRKRARQKPLTGWEKDKKRAEEQSKLQKKLEDASWGCKK